jgi:hypothetical protein
MPSSIFELVIASAVAAAASSSWAECASTGVNAPAEGIPMRICGRLLLPPGYLSCCGCAASGSTAGGGGGGVLVRTVSFSSPPASLRLSWATVYVLPVAERKRKSSGRRAYSWFSPVASSSSWERSSARDVPSVTKTRPSGRESPSRYTSTSLAGTGRRESTYRAVGSESSAPGPAGSNEEEEVDTDGVAFML